MKADSDRIQTERPGAATALAGHIGAGALFGAAYMGGLGHLGIRTVYWILIAPFRGKPLRWLEIVRQMVRVEYSVWIVGLVLYFVGMILAIQMAVVLQMFGVTAYVGPVVGLATFRELGPLITAVVLTGYAGASIAAELGTMKVNEEIMALEVSALNPIGFLVVPRMLGLLVMGLCLTVLGNLIAIAGGLFIGYAVLGVWAREYVSLTASFLSVKDFLTGMVKAGVFAILIGLIACYEGLNVDGGAEGVGRATTRAVVLSIIFVIVFDCFFTTLFYFVLE